jgi:hypothetical protein
MNKFILTPMLLASVFVRSSNAANLNLDDVTISFVDIAAHDIAYDSRRNVLYATATADDAKFAGRLVIVNPLTRQVIDSVEVGSEPRQLELSQDGSRLYIGVDGERGFRWWSPDSGQLSPITLLDDGMSVAEDLAISPADPAVLFVSKDYLPDSRSGDLGMYIDGAEVPVTLPYPDNSVTAHRIGFVDASTLASFNIRSTSYDVSRWNVASNGFGLEENRQTSGGFRLEGEVADNRLYRTNGTVIDAGSLSDLGTYATPANYNAWYAAVEPFHEAGAFYSLGRKLSANEPYLLLYDSASFLMIDEVSLFRPGVSRAEFDVAELIHAGPGRLAYVTHSNEFGMLYGAPIPEPSSALLVATIVAVGSNWRRRKFCALTSTSPLGATSGETQSLPAR